MSISGLVIHARPEKMESVKKEIVRFPGLEIHKATEDGRLIVTVDVLENAEATDTFIKLQDVDGVVSTSLVYNYFEEEENANREKTS